jgi:hypothetical protein
MTEFMSNDCRCLVLSNIGDRAPALVQGGHDASVQLAFSAEAPHRTKTTNNKRYFSDISTSKCRSF